jgi:hypothetical protein
MTLITFQRQRGCHSGSSSEIVRCLLKVVVITLSQYVDNNLFDNAKHFFHHAA